MPEAHAPPDPTLQTTALRYAAGDLTPAEAAAFEARLADDQDTRDALAEAVRLSAAALGQEPPAPHRSFRAAIRERLAVWCPGWLARRAYRGHPAVWAGIGAFAVAACTTTGLMLADGEAQPEPVGEPYPVAAVATPEPHHTLPAAAGTADAHAGESLVAAPPPSGCDDPHAQSVAELWAEWSTPDAIEKSHDDEMKWRQKLREAGAFQSARGAGVNDSHQP